jgi:hypothetical protein
MAGRDTRSKGGGVRRLSLVSYVLVALGLMAILAGEAGGANATWTLTGLLLVVAGVIKVAVIVLWRTVAGFRDSNHITGEEAP